MSYAFKELFERCDEDGKPNKNGNLYRLQSIHWILNGKSISSDSMSAAILHTKLSGVRRPTIGRSGNWKSVVVVPEHIATSVVLWLENARPDSDEKLVYMDMGLREFLLKLHES